MRDFRFAFRTLSRAPFFTVIALLTLALGIGATTAIFTVVDGVLLRPLPYPEPQRIVRLWEVSAKGGHMNFSDPDFEDIQEQTRSFTSLARVSPYGIVSVVGGSSPVRARSAAVSKEFFRTMGVQPARGRFFVPDEQREGGTPAVVVSAGFWRSSLGGAPSTERSSTWSASRRRSWIIPPGPSSGCLRSSWAASPVAPRTAGR